MTLQNMPRVVALALLTLILSVPVLAEEEAEEAPLDIDTILNQTSDKDDYVDAPRCLRLHKIREVKVIDERHVTFQTGRNTFYLVQLEHRCPGLTRDSTIAYSSSSSRVCRLDKMHAVIRFGPMTERLGPACAIPGFQEITKEQLTALRDSLRKVPAKEDPEA